MRARSARSQLVLGAPGDDLLLVEDVVADHLAQVERARHAVRERDHVDAERLLQRRVLVELVEHDLRDRVALQLDHEPHAGAVGLVAQVADLGDLLVVHELGDLLDQPAVVAAPFFTMKGSSVTMIASLPSRSGSTWARPRITTRPRPVS